MKDNVLLQDNFETLRLRQIRNKLFPTDDEQQADMNRLFAIKDEIKVLLIERSRLLKSCFPVGSKISYYWRNHLQEGLVVQHLADYHDTPELRVRNVRTGTVTRITLNAVPSSLYTT